MMQAIININNSYILLINQLKNLRALILNPSSEYKFRCPYFTGTLFWLVIDCAIYLSIRGLKQE